MWTYNFYPSYRLEITTNVHEIVRDKAKILMEYQINSITIANLSQNNKLYERTFFAFFGIICEQLNA